MKKYIFVLIASLMATAGMAQDQLTEQQQRLLRQKVYEVLTKYAESHSLSNEERIETFTSLFADPSMEIYNDLLGLTAGRVLTVEDYVNTLSSGAKQVEVQVMNLRKGEPYVNGDTWQIPVEFDKRIAYTNGIGVRLDSYEYYDANYKVKMQLVLDNKTGRCYIGGMEGNIQSDRRPLSGTYSVLMRQNEQDDRFTVKGRRVTFNNRGQMIVPGTISKSDLTYDGADDFRVQTERSADSDVRKVYIEYVPKPFRVKLHGSIALGDFYSLNGKPKDLTTSSSNFNVGLDFGYIFLNKKSLSMGLFAGVGLSKSSFMMNLAGTYSFDYESKEDIDGDTYQRHYTNATGFSQNLNVTDITVPFYFDIEYHFNRSFSAFIDLGLKMHANMGNALKANENASIDRVYGVYQYGGNLEINGDVAAINGFNNHNVSDVNTTDLKMNFAVDALLGLGLRYKFMKQLGAELGVQYQAGLTNCWKNDGSPILGDKGDKILIRYYDDKEHMEPLLRTGSGLKHNGLRLHLGVIYYF